MRERKDVEVLVGCDSHNHGRHTVYTTTVVLRYFRNGAQVVTIGEKKRPQGEATCGPASVG